MIDSRLNPKLTRRNLAVNLPLGELEGHSETASTNRSKSEDASSTTSRSHTSATTSNTDNEEPPPIMIPRTNPRLHLIHNGKWIPRVYDYGRLRARTGIWNCCGHTEHLSIYCDSEEKRESFRKELEAERLKDIEEKNQRIARKQYLLEQIQLIEKFPVDFENYSHKNNLEVPARQIESSNEMTMEEMEEAGLLATDPLEELAKKKALAQRAKKNEENEVHQEAKVSKVETVTAVPAAAPSSSLPTIDHSLNAPMTMSFLLRHFQEDPTVLQGLDFVIAHLDTGEGCRLFVRHGLVNLLYRITEFHHKHSQILLLVLQSLRQLLDCNLTRDEVLDENKHSIVKLIFNVVYLHMSSLEHIEPGVRALMQCTRYEECRKAMVEMQVIPYLLIVAKKYMKHTPPYFLNSLLKIFHWMCTDLESAQYLVSLKSLHYALKAMKCHPRHRLVLIPSIAFLRKVTLLIPGSTIQWMLKYNVTAMIINSLEIVYDNQEIQLEALKLLQIISMTSKGWEQISSIRGAWQRICQGTEKGDALVHDLPGDFQNPGWVLAETPYLPLLERLKLSAYENQKNSLELKPKAAWTAASLRQYMGLSMAGQSLAINTEYQEIYFQLLTTLDLLPREEEAREDWFIRIRKFEAENEVKIEEMVYTVQEMKKRDAIQKKLAAQRLTLAGNASDGDYTGITVKEVYVAGQKIDGKFLAENDIDLDEAFYDTL